MQAKAKAHQEHEHFPRHLDRTLELINHLVLHLLCRQLRGVGHVVLVEAKLQQGSTIIKKNRHMKNSLTNLLANLIDKEVTRLLPRERLLFLE